MPKTIFTLVAIVAILLLLVFAGLYRFGFLNGKIKKEYNDLKVDRAYITSFPGYKSCAAVLFDTPAKEPVSLKFISGVGDLPAWTPSGISEFNLKKDDIVVSLAYKESNGRWQTRVIPSKYCAALAVSMP